MIEKLMTNINKLDDNDSNKVNVRKVGNAIEIKSSNGCMIMGEEVFNSLANHPYFQKISLNEAYLADKNINEDRDV